jgi:acyl-CoA hydrolase
VLHLIDIAAAIAAYRHCGKKVVTASFDRVDFLHPVKVGELMVLKASVNYTARTSMEVGVQVQAEDLDTGNVRQTASAYTTFVALGDDGQPTEIPPVLPETSEERRRWEEGKARRAVRLRELDARKQRRRA